MNDGGVRVTARLLKPSEGPSAPGRRLEGEQFGAKLRYAPLPRQKFLDVAKAKEAVGAWATELASKTNVMYI